MFGRVGSRLGLMGTRYVRPAYRLSSFQNKSESSAALQAKLVTGWAGAWRLSASPGACTTLLLLHQEEVWQPQACRVGQPDRSFHFGS